MKAIPRGLLALFLLTAGLACRAQEKDIVRVTRRQVGPGDLLTGAARTAMYLPALSGKQVAVMANHTSTVGSVHLVDSLLSLGVKIVKVFAPEHGFRGQAEAGEKVTDEKDGRTGLPVISLYGKKMKPGKREMENVEAVVFDIQDAGVRFYTYAASMQYLMEACAEKSIPMIVLDRPNPIGYYVDGPVLKPEQASFVGLNPVPLVHGLTLGEYAMMINGEGWLQSGKKCDLTVIPVSNYNHNYLYQLPLPPSPNLPNMAAIYLYPSLGLFEGTPVSIGRGTGKPFQVIGYPGMPDGNFTFTPQRMPGFSLNPPYLDQACQGYDLGEFGMNFLKDAGTIYLFWLLETYRQYPRKDKFFTPFFDKLAGTAELRRQVTEGWTEEQIRKSWGPELAGYKKMRKKYLLYPDFE